MKTELSKNELSQIKGGTAVTGTQASVESILATNTNTTTGCICDYAPNDKNKNKASGCVCQPV